MDLSPEGRAKRIVQEYLKRSQGKVIEPNKIVVSPLFSLANDVFRVSL